MQIKSAIVLLSVFAAPASGWADEVTQPAAARADQHLSYSDNARARNLDRDLSSTAPIVEKALVEALVNTLSQTSRYPSPVELPDIKRVPHHQLEAMICNNSSCGVLASYWHGEGIYLDDNLKLETSLFARSVLLHELVHYMQDMNEAWGELNDCDRWYHRELEAYALQMQFLIDIGSAVRVAYSPSGPTCDATPREANAQDSISRR